MPRKKKVWGIRYGASRWVRDNQDGTYSFIYQRGTEFPTEESAQTWLDKHRKFLPRMARVEVGEM